MSSTEEGKTKKIKEILNETEGYIKKKEEEFIKEGYSIGYMEYFFNRINDKTEAAIYDAFSYADKDEDYKYSEKKTEEMTDFILTLLTDTSESERFIENAVPKEGKHIVLNEYRASMDGTFFMLTAKLEHYGIIKDRLTDKLPDLREDNAYLLDCEREYRKTIKILKAGMIPGRADYVKNAVEYINRTDDIIQLNPREWIRARAVKNTLIKERSGICTIEKKEVLRKAEAKLDEYVLYRYSMKTLKMYDESYDTMYSGITDDRWRLKEFVQDNTSCFIKEKAEKGQYNEKEAAELKFMRLGYIGCGIPGSIGYIPEPGEIAAEAVGFRDAARENGEEDMAEEFENVVLRRLVYNRDAIAAYMDMDEKDEEYAVFTPLQRTFYKEADASIIICETMKNDYIRRFMSSEDPDREISRAIDKITNDYLPDEEEMLRRAALYNAVIAVAYRDEGLERVTTFLNRIEEDETRDGYGDDAEVETFMRMALIDPGLGEYKDIENTQYLMESRIMDMMRLDENEFKVKTEEMVTRCERSGDPVKAMEIYAKAMSMVHEETEFFIKHKGESISMNKDDIYKEDSEIRGIKALLRLMDKWKDKSGYFKRERLTEMIRDCGLRYKRITSEIPEKTEKEAER